MPRPICVPCAVEMRCEKNDQAVNDRAIEPFPATYWRGDRFKCPECSTEVVIGFGRACQEPIPDSIEFRY